MTEQEYEALEGSTWEQRWRGSLADEATPPQPPTQSPREARRAREQAEAEAREAARMTQAQADAYVAQIVAESGRPRSIVAVLPDVSEALTTSHAGYWDSRGIGAAGTLPGGRAWRLGFTYGGRGHIVIG